MFVINNGSRYIPSGPTQQPRTQTKVRIITEREEGLVETPCFLKNFAVVQGSTSIRPKDLLRFVVLTDVGFHCASATILAIPVDEMARLVDDPWWVLEKDLARQH